MVERGDALYLSDHPRSGWADLHVASFGLQDGEVFDVGAMDAFDEVVIDPDDDGAPSVFVMNSPDRAEVVEAPFAAPPLAAAAAAPRGPLAAPAYAGAIGGPPPWEPRSVRPPVPDIHVAAPSPARAPAGVQPQDWALIGPHIVTAVQAALRPELEQLAGRLSHVEASRVAMPTSAQWLPFATPQQAPPAPAPGMYFTPPDRAPPIAPQYFPYGAPAAASADATAVAEARALLSGTVSARAATSQALRLSAPTARRSGGPGTLTVARLLQLLTTEGDDLTSLLGSDEVLGGVAGASGAKGLAALERARVAFEANPRALWDFVMAMVTRNTRVGGGGLIAYFEGSAVQNDEMALFVLHLVDRISTACLAEDGDMVLGLCGSAITFLDQAARDSFSLTLAQELSLIRDPELPYLGPATDADKRQRARYGKPFSPLVDPSTYAAVTAAFKDIEVLTKAAAAAKKGTKGGPKGGG